MIVLLRLYLMNKIDAISDPEKPESPPLTLDDDLEDGPMPRRPRELGDGWDECEVCQ